VSNVNKSVRKNRRYMNLQKNEQISNRDGEENCNQSESVWDEENQCPVLRQKTKSIRNKIDRGYYDNNNDGDESYYENRVNIYQNRKKNKEHPIARRAGEAAQWGNYYSGYAEEHQNDYNKSRNNSRWYKQDDNRNEDDNDGLEKSIKRPNRRHQ